MQREPDYKFNLLATAEDQGENPKSSVIELDIKVVESHKKAPAFVPRPLEPLKVQENFSDFDASLVRLQAVSNIDEDTESIFELVIGRTEQTNKQNTFRY